VSAVQQAESVRFGRGAMAGHVGASRASCGRRMNGFTVDMMPQMRLYAAVSIYVPSEDIAGTAVRKRRYA